LVLQEKIEGDKIVMEVQKVSLILVQSLIFPCLVILAMVRGGEDGLPD